MSKKRKIRSSKEDAISEVEANILLSGCVDLLDNLVVRLPLYTGMRIGEVQHLSRAITIFTKMKPGTYIKAPPDPITVPFNLGIVPQDFKKLGTCRAMTAWTPLVMVAQGVGDDDFLQYAYGQVDEATDALKEGQGYELR